jgi:transcriptional antiterminator RfaH
LNKGDAVRITTGPFHDLEGIYLMDDGRDRALVLLQFLGEQRAVQVEDFRLSRVFA